MRVSICIIAASFIPKCSLSDPNLGDCIKEKANIAIPLVAKGVPEFDIPPVNPAYLRSTQSKELHLIMNDVYCDDLKDFRLTKAYFDIKKGKAEFTISLDRLVSLTTNYNLTSGMLLGLPVSGHGKFNMTMVGIIVDYSSDIKTYDKGDDTYLSLANGMTSTSIERGYYYFENLQSPEEASFIPKCSLSDPNLGDCIKEKANIAIPIIAEGVPEFDIPSLSPVRVPVAVGKELHLVVEDTYIHGFKDFRLTKALMEVVGVKYSFTSGMLLGLPVSGHGKYNVTMVGITVNYSSDTKTYDKGDDTYLSFANGTTLANVERGYYHFENLQSPKEGDMNKYVDDHWQDFRFQLKPAKREIRKNVMDSVVLSVLSLVALVTAGEYDLPSYIPKCSLSDPNLGDCIKDKANIVIPILAKGDPKLGISSISPLQIAIAEAKALQLIVYDVFTDDLKDLKVAKASFDVKSGKAAFTLSLDRIDSFSQNYTFTNGMLLGLPVSGHGKYTVKLIGITIDYTADVKTYEKGGDTYIRLENDKCSSNLERGYYHFENLQSPNEKDINQYVDDHWQEYRAQLKPAIEFYLTEIVHVPIAKIFEKFPLNKIFLP
ncbi:hypothetical protein Trydic_g9023 [Trypoxylus dichotomus]